MKKIVLLCAAGMSTSMLVKKMQEAAAAESYECSIAAYPTSEANAKASDADVILLGQFLSQLAEDWSAHSNYCSGIHSGQKLALEVSVFCVLLGV